MGASERNLEKQRDSLEGARAGAGKTPKNSSEKPRANPFYREPEPEPVKKNIKQGAGYPRLEILKKSD